jgi:threonine dehydrogenase-like Zn-dependent dehydrogenase
MKTRNWLVSFISLILPSVLVNQIVALTLNLRAWFFSLFQRVRTNQTALAASAASGAAIMIDGPGGAEQFRFENLIESDRATVGYNCPPHVCPLTLPGISKSLGVEDVLVKVQYFSVNFADVAIRWGLYESANQKVGYPICPGFDFVGVVEKAGSSSGFSYVICVCSIFFCHLE